MGLPDINLLEPLAEALEISLTELIRSEKIESDTLTKDAADAAVAGTLEIAQAKRKDFHRSPLWRLSFVLVCAVMCFFIVILIRFVDVPWIRAIGIYLTVLCGSLGLNAVGSLLDHRLNPDIPAPRQDWRSCLISVSQYLGLLLLLLSFPIRSFHGNAACDIARLVGFLLVGAVSMYDIIRHWLD